MPYRPEPPPDKQIFCRTGDLSSDLSLPKNTGYTGYKRSAVDQLLDETVVAVLINSNVVGAPIWFALRDEWRPDAADHIPVFYLAELPSLRSKTPEQLRSIFNAKLAFGGGRVQQ